MTENKHQWFSSFAKYEFFLFFSFCLWHRHIRNGLEKKWYNRHSRYLKCSCKGCGAQKLSNQVFISRRSSEKFLKNTSRPPPWLQQWEQVLLSNTPLSADVVECSLELFRHVNQRTRSSVFATTVRIRLKQVCSLLDILIQTLRNVWQLNHLPKFLEVAVALLS